MKNRLYLSACIGSMLGYFAVTGIAHDLPRGGETQPLSSDINPLHQEHSTSPSHMGALARFLQEVDHHKSLRKKYTLPRGESFSQHIPRSQQKLIARQELFAPVTHIMKHPKFTIPLADIGTFASIISHAQLEVDDYSWYIEKLLFYDIPAREVAERAVKRHAYQQWAHTRFLATLADNPDNFVDQVHRIAVPADYQQRLIKVYSLCIDSYRLPENRHFMRKIVVSSPRRDYHNPPPERDPLVEAIPRPVDSTDAEAPYVQAFSLMSTAARNIADEQGLDDWQRACLAKCIADEMIEYRSAADHPVAAALLFYRSFLRSGAINMGSKYGICTTYARVTKSLAKELGFASRVRIGRRRKHFFNQFKIEGKWYHFHPLRKYGKECTFIPY